MIVFVGLGIWFATLLPEPLFHQPLSAVLVSEDEQLLGGRIAADGQWRFPPVTQVPDKFAAAVIAYEDKRFLQHPGIDPLAVMRALRFNVRRQRVVSGASTITMQLARLIDSQDDSTPRSWRQKMFEAAMALRLELQYTKSELLALYVSHAPFGGNVVGVDAAAWRYFGRSAERLSWAEAATLAVLPNAPALVTPGRQRARLQAKRDALLRRLAAIGELTAVDLQAALAEPLVSAPRPLPDLAPHLLETLKQRYPTQHRFVTTLNPAIQRFAKDLLEERAIELRRQGIGNAAALIVDNQSFTVVAYVGNVSGDNPEHAASVDIVQRPRSTGSILKPLLFAAMLDAGQLLPSTLVPDVPTKYRDFSPENFDRGFRGAVPANVALAQSLNIPAVRMLDMYGVAHFHDVLTHLGMRSLTETPDHYGLSLILGGAEATLWDVTQMHANLAWLAHQSGDRPPYYQRVRALSDQSVQSSAEQDTTDKKLSVRAADISPGAAWLTLNALLQVTRPAEEANWQAFASSRNIAWKTGTSWGLRDAWAVGSTSRYTVGIWAGNANSVGVAGLTGATTAAPLLFALHEQLPLARWFDMPLRALRPVTVCRDDGYLAVDGCQTKSEWAPINSHFDQQSPHHQWIHLDAKGQRVDADCEDTTQMRHVAWFVLPPAQEYYFRRSHADYQAMLMWRKDCQPERQLRTGRAIMEFVYPSTAGQIYLPVEMNGVRGQVVFEAVHRLPGTTLYWHLDDRYLGSTQTLHQMTANIEPGTHLLAIVDEQGNRVARTFEVINQVRSNPAP